MAKSLFEHFKTFEDMKAHALDVFKATTMECYMEAGIYTDNHGLTYRPEVRIVFEDGSWLGLRWYAYADEQGIDFMSARAKREAHESALKYIWAIKQERDRMAAPKGWQQVEAGPEGTSLEAGPMVSPDDIAAMPKAPMRYKVTLVWNGKIVLEGTMTASVAWELIRHHMKANFVHRSDMGDTYPPLSVLHNGDTGQAATGGYKDSTGEAMWCLEVVG